MSPGAERDTFVHELGEQWVVVVGGVVSYCVNRSKLRAARWRCDAGMGGEGDIERGSAFSVSAAELVVHGVGYEADAGMRMLSVVPAKEVLAMRARVLDRPEVVSSRPEAAPAGVITTDGRLTTTTSQGMR